MAKVLRTESTCQSPVKTHISFRSHPPATRPQPPGGDSIISRVKVIAVSYCTCAVLQRGPTPPTTRVERMSKRRALSHDQALPLPSLNSSLNEDSTSESEREDDEYVEQVQRFRAVFKRKLFSATSLDLDGWEPAEDDATASTASASEAFGDRCMQVGAQEHQHASLGRGEGVVRSDEGQHWVQEDPAPAVLAPSSWSGPSVKLIHYDVVKLKLGPPSGSTSERVKRTLGEISPISLISPPSPTEVVATEKEGEVAVEAGTTGNGQEAEERVVEEEQSRPASTMEEKRPTSSRPTRAKTRRGFLRSDSKSYDRTIIGKRIRVYWEWNRVWYPGVVKDYAPAGELHTVCYDDGDQRDEPLNFNGAIQWELLSTATAT